MSRRILIVGGVAGGASAATRLRRLDEGAEIVLFDRGPYVSFANCGLPYYVGNVISDERKLLVASRESFRDRFNIDVLSEHEALKIFLPDDEALTPAMAEAYKAVGLTTAEIQILAKAQKKRDYYYRSVKGRRLFELGLGPAALALVGASSEKDQAFLDELVATRDPRDYARALFERRGVPWTGAGDTAPIAAATSPIDLADDEERGRDPDTSDAQTVPISAGVLAELLSSDVFDSGAVTTVPCPPPKLEPKPSPRWRKRGP
jgi:hypothetical protein